VSDTIEQIKQKLAILAPERLDIVDESAQHAGHAGAAGGGGHYRLIIVSSRFKNVNVVGRHRMIYEALGEMMKERIHALSISAFAPDEF
jgi:BolA protein